MECLYCGSPKTTVSNSVKDGKKVLREKACKSCYRIFYTEETIRLARQETIKKTVKNKKMGKQKKVERSGNEKKVLYAAEVVGFKNYDTPL